MWLASGGRGKVSWPAWQVSPSLRLRCSARPGRCFASSSRAVPNRRGCCFPNLPSAPLSDAEVQQEFVKQNVKVKFEYAVLRKDDLLKQIQPNEAELKAFYERNKATYNNSIPEKRKLRYVVLDMAKIQAETAVSREDLQVYYDQHKDDYRVPEQVSVSHILIKTPLPGADGKVDGKGVEEARKKADDVL